MAQNILPPQNAPVFEQNSDGSYRMTRAWVLFFQQLQKLSTEVLTTIQSGLVDNFVTIDQNGNIQDSGYDQTSFVHSDVLPSLDVATDMLTALTGGTPNLQKKSRSIHVVDGIIQAIGAETAATDIKPKAYTDIAMGLQASPSGSSAPNLVAWNGSNIYAYGFNGTSTSEQLFGTCEYNHDYKEGADIYPHIHWAPTNTATTNVKWNLDYVWDNPGEGPSAAQTISIIQAASGAAYRPQFAQFPTISGTGKKIGSQIQFRLWRNPGDTEDTYAAVAVIQTMGIHAEVDSFGSANVGTK